MDDALFGIFARMCGMDSVVGMLTTDIRVNGALIGHLYIVNRGRSEAFENATYYTYEYYEPDEGRLRKGEVVHNPDDGALGLISKVIKDVRRR